MAEINFENQRQAKEYIFDTLNGVGFGFISRSLGMGYSSVTLNQSFGYEDDMNAEEHFKKLSAASEVVFGQNIFTAENLQMGAMESSVQIRFDRKDFAALNIIHAEVRFDDYRMDAKKRVHAVLSKMLPFREEDETVQQMFDRGMQVITYTGKDSGGKAKETKKFGFMQGITHIEDPGEIRKFASLVAQELIDSIQDAYGANYFDFQVANADGTPTLMAEIQIPFISLIDMTIRDVERGVSMDKSENRITIGGKEYEITSDDMIGFADSVNQRVLGRGYIQDDEKVIPERLIETAMSTVANAALAIREMRTEGDAAAATGSISYTPTELEIVAEEVGAVLGIEEGQRTAVARAALITLNEIATDKDLERKGRS